MSEPKRIKKLKKELIKQLPFFPNNKETLLELESQNIHPIMLHYLHWQARQVPVRQRSVQLAPEVTSDKRWNNLKENINLLFDKVRTGVDLSPHLSSKAHQKAYSPIETRNAKMDKWEDKDFILNTKGFHHFHLDMNIQNNGLVKRTNDVLFARVQRDSFHAVGIFDHSVFGSCKNIAEPSNELERLWKIYDKLTTLGLPPETVYISNPITTSGHPLFLVDESSRYCEIILSVDARLDDYTYIKSLYQEAKVTTPKKYKFEWFMDGLDLKLLDKKNSMVFIFKHGFL